MSSTIDGGENKKSIRSKTQQQKYYMPCMPGGQGVPNMPSGFPLGQPTSPLPIGMYTANPEMYSNIPNQTPAPLGTYPSMPEIIPGGQGTPDASTPPLFSGENTAQTVLDTDYTAGYLRTIIGRIVVVTFLIGTSTLTDQSGRLVKVGASYIILQDIISGSQTMCDLYSIKFVRIYR